MRLKLFRILTVGELKRLLAEVASDTPLAVYSLDDTPLLPMHLEGEEVLIKLSVKKSLTSSITYDNKET